MAKVLAVGEHTGAEGDGAASAAAGPVDFALEGRLTADTAAPVWRAARELLERHPQQPIVVDASRLQHVDAVGLALILDLVDEPRSPQAKVELQGLAPKLAALIQGGNSSDFISGAAKRASQDIATRIGAATLALGAQLRDAIAFAGACAQALAAAFGRGGAVRWKEVVSVAAEAGANAVPIVLLVGFLMGVIIAYEVGQVARSFGAIIYVVNGVGVGMLRELGAVMTAIVFAGRTGAAFAAQIGTEKVNQELDALRTFGLDPVRFLVLPRLLAAMLAVPLLTVLADVAGLAGGALAMSNFGVGWLEFYSQLLTAVDASDFLFGIVKSVVFGLTIAAIGCRRGLATGAGAAAVGMSATRTVVASIVWVVAIDGVFAVLSS